MALKQLSVDEFLGEVLQSLNLPRLKYGTKFNILFSGESSRFNIKFQGSDRLFTVYKHICAIETNREELKKSSNMEQSKESGKLVIVTPRSDVQKVIMAEVDMVLS